LIKPIHHI